jgi:twitching motility protein PilT
MVLPLLSDTQKKVLKEQRQLDFSCELDQTTRFRVNLFEQLKGLSAVFRLIPLKIRGFEELGLPEIVRGFAGKERGLVLITGPTGCGKSTTLAAVVDHINEHEGKHVITIEDPIEFIHQSKNSLINQREVGQHAESFQSALRVALREDPDVLLVGEMRDLETISLTLTAAETGHLVFSTLHTSSAAQTIDRIIDIFPANAKGQIRMMLSESLVGIVSQRLIPSKNGKGRALALEILSATIAVRNLIREDKVYQLGNFIQSGSEHGMLPLDASLADLIKQGKISREEAAKIAEDPKKFK